MFVWKPIQFSIEDSVGLIELLDCRIQQCEPDQALYDAREYLGYSGEPLESLEGARRRALIVDPEKSCKCRGQPYNRVGMFTAVFTYQQRYSYTYNNIRIPTIQPISCIQAFILTPLLYLYAISGNWAKFRKFEHFYKILMFNI